MLRDYLNEKNFFLRSKIMTLIIHFNQFQNEIIATKVVEVSVGDDGDLQFADSEQTESEAMDSEVDLCDYWSCAQCLAKNNNPLYRYCEKCFKVRY